MEEDRLVSDKSWTGKINTVEGELQGRRMEEQKKAIILRDRDREARLNDLRIKELKKLAGEQLGHRRKLGLAED